MWLDPRLWLALILSGLALFGYGFYEGKQFASSACAADQAQAQQAAQTKADETNTRREQVAQSREISREQIRVVYRTIKEKAHENTAAADCSLDDDGLRLWNAANAGQPAQLFGQLDYRLSGAATGQVGQVGRFAVQPYRVDGAVRAMPRPAEETGGVREGDAVSSDSPLRGVREE